MVILGLFVGLFWFQVEPKEEYLRDRINFVSCNSQKHSSLYSTGFHFQPMVPIVYISDDYSCPITCSPITKILIKIQKRYFVQQIP